MKRLLFFLMFAAVIVSTAPVLGVSASYTPPFELYGESVLLMNVDTDTVVFEKNAGERVFPASTTKVMTAILALENIENLDATATATADHIDGVENTATIGLRRGEILPLRDLMYGMLLQSGNDAANVIADYVGGGIPNFVDMMNRRAKELGCYDTNFANPHGLYNEANYTTAYDMYKIFKHAMSLPMFEEIISTRSYMLPETNKRVSQALTPTNDMLKPTRDVYYPPMIGGKTGYLPEAGRNFVSEASEKGYKYIACVFKTPTVNEAGLNITTNYAFIDTKNLYEWAFDNFEVKTLLTAGKVVTEVPLLLSSDKDFLLLSAQNSFAALVPKDVTEDSVDLKLNKPEEAKAPIKKGDLVGTIDLMLNGDIIGTVNLLANENVRRNEWLYRIYWTRNFVKTPVFKVSVIIICILIIAILALRFAALRARGGRRAINHRRSRRYR